MRGKTSLSDVELVSYERGSSDFFETKRMIFDSILFLLITLFISSIGLSIYFYYAAPSFTDSFFLSTKGIKVSNEFISPVGN
ncbi:UNVERIFIED_CONTAM: hypothetical protein O8I53_08665 [Campylobacter lari]